MNCPNCSAPVAEGKKFCRSCGAAIPAQPPPTPVCPNCGSPVVQGKKFCFGCGIEHGAQPQSMAAGPPPFQSSATPPLQVEQAAENVLLKKIRVSLQGATQSVGVALKTVRRESLTAFIILTAFILCRVVVMFTVAVMKPMNISPLYLNQLLWPLPFILRGLLENIFMFMFILLSLSHANRGGEQKFLVNPFAIPKNKALFVLYTFALPLALSFVTVVVLYWRFIGFWRYDWYSYIWMLMAFTLAYTFIAFCVSLILRGTRNRGGFTYLHVAAGITMVFVFFTKLLKVIDPRGISNLFLFYNSSLLTPKFALNAPTGAAVNAVNWEAAMHSVHRMIRHGRELFGGILGIVITPETIFIIITLLLFATGVAKKRGLTVVIGSIFITLYTVLTLFTNNNSINIMEYRGGGIWQLLHPLGFLGHFFMDLLYPDRIYLSGNATHYSLPREIIVYSFYMLSFILLLRICTKALQSTASQSVTQPYETYAPHDYESDETQLMQPPQSPVEHVTVFYCKKCGAKQESGNQFCHECGTEVRKQEVTL